MGGFLMIVGFCGAAGSGKDTAADALVRHADYYKHSFAGPLKRALDRIFQWEPNWESLEWKETPRPEAFNKTPRELAQSLGTDWGRKMVNDSIWVNSAIAEAVGDMLNYGHNVVFTDVRFPNEAAAIRAQGGVLIFVTCIDRMTGTNSNQHESEQWNEWLYMYADCEISAAFGAVQQLQEAALNVVENYQRGDAPRYEPSAEVLSMLNDIAEKVMGKTNV